MQKSSNKRPMLMDVDTGIDDALALIVADHLVDSFELECVTTVAGNVGIEDATDNTRSVLGLLGRDDVQVARGSAGPIAHGWTPSAQVHGERGLGTLDRDALLAGPPLADLSAVESIIQKARQHSGQLTVIATGPLTNVALALRSYPDLRRHIDKVVVMGGAFDQPGNVSPVAEYNFHVDPLAADIVMMSGLDILLVPLDVTYQVVVSRGQLESWQEKLGLARRQALASFALDVLDFYIASYAAAGKSAGAMHDPVAVIVAARPDLFTFRQVPVRVEAQSEMSRGLCIQARELVAGSRPVQVATGVDSGKCIRILFDAIFA